MKIIVLAAPGESTDILVNRLIDEGADELRVLMEPAQSKRSLLRLRVRKLGWGKVLGQIAFMLSVPRLLRPRSEARLSSIKRTFGLRSDAIPEALVKRVPSVNSEETRSLLRAFAPDVVVLNGTRIVKRATLEATQAPVLNIHAGITPEFRGVHGGYWALHTKQPQEFGATLHMVDTGVDTGGVLAHVRPEPSDQDNFVTYPLLQLAAALPELSRVLEGLRKGQGLPDPVPTQGEGEQWYHPTLWQYLAGRLRNVR